MSQLSSHFVEKKILVVVAHPDDESLYFYGGLRELASCNEVTVLSVTYDHMSVRGKELEAACAHLGVKISFLGVEDPGMFVPLRGAKSALVRFLDLNGPYHTIITHPPHGGEKPHPHHLQIFWLACAESRRRGMKFGFFSEALSPAVLSQKTTEVFYLSTTSCMALYWRVLKAFNIPHGVSWLSHVVSLMATLAMEGRLRGTYQRAVFRYDPQDKREQLAAYQSQESFLRTYRTSRAGEDYFFFEA